jgi:ketosteroid isomerase-like protein
MMSTANDVGRDRVTEETRKVALALFEGMESVEAMDALLASDADWWGVGAGTLDRSIFVAVHKPYVDRPEPTYRRTKLLGLVVEGERAAIEMEWEISWPDVTYHQFYHHVLIVRDGKIVSMRMYLDPNEGAKLFASAEETKAMSDAVN